MIALLKEIRQNKMQKIIYSIQFYIGKIVLFLIEFPIRLVTKNEVILSNENFSWTEIVEANFEQIKQEVLTILHQNQTLDITYFSEEQHKVIKPTYWSVFPLVTFGNVITDNIKKCPQTYNVLQQIPNCTTAFFSILQPHAKIARHRGIYKGYLRYHLCVKAPINTDECALVFDKITYHWKEKESVIFDDTFYHSVYNHSDEIRIVLYVDFIRPLPQSLFFLSKSMNELIRNSRYIKNLKTK